MGKRDDILAATLDLVVDEGLPALSFSKIFEKADVGSGTVYHYFPNKETLVFEVYRTAADRMDQAVLNGFDRSAPLKTRFSQLLTGVARFALESPRELAFLQSCSHAPSIPAELRHRVTVGMNMALELFDEGRRDGVFAAMPPMVALAICTGAVTSLAEWALEGKVAWDEGVLSMVVESCWKGLSV